MGESQKVTYQLSVDVINEVKEAVEAGYAPSMSRFVEDAMRERLRAIREQQIREQLKKAVKDPLVARDVALIEAALGDVEVGGEP